MTEKTLIPIDGSKDNRAALRRLRRERRAVALAEGQPPAQLDSDVPAEVPVRSRGREPATQISADAFVLPPRAQLRSSTTKFGRFLRATFFLFVLAPTVLAILFYAFVASDQYASTAQFAVRGSSSSSSSSGPTMGLIALGGAAETEIADSFILQSYIHSREVVESLVNEANFIEVYSRPSVDQYYRLSSSPPPTIEQLVKYWQMMCEVEFDLETGIITLTVRAFRPSDAEAIIRKVVERAEALVNELSVRARDDTLNDSKREVAIAEARYGKARQAVAAYREQGGEVDPTATANTRQSLMGSLESDVARLEAQLTSLRATMSENSPRVVYVRNQIDSMRRQIATERLRVAVQQPNDPDQQVLTQRISRYEELLTDRDFAQKAYESSQEMLEAARQDALRQQRYLAVFVRGTAPEESTYPDAIRWTLILFASLLVLWGAFAMTAAAIRDRTS